MELRCGLPVKAAPQDFRERAMLKWAVVFLIIAIIAGIFGFTDVEAASATIAQWLFGIFLVLFLGALIIGLAIGRSLTS